MYKCGQLQYLYPKIDRYVFCMIFLWYIFESILIHQHFHIIVDKKWQISLPKPIVPLPTYWHFGSQYKHSGKDYLRSNISGEWHSLKLRNSVTCSQVKTHRVTFRIFYFILKKIKLFVILTSNVFSVSYIWKLQDLNYIFIFS